jgi:hypothetical protein
MPDQVPQAGPAVIHRKNLSIRVTAPEQAAHWIKSSCEELWTRAASQLSGLSLHRVHPRRRVGDLVLDIKTFLLWRKPSAR